MPSIFLHRLSVVCVYLYIAATTQGPAGRDPCHTPTASVGKKRRGHTFRMARTKCRVMPGPPHIHLYAPSKANSCRHMKSLLWIQNQLILYMVLWPIFWVSIWKCIQMHRRLWGYHLWHIKKRLQWWLTLWLKIKPRIVSTCFTELC